MTREEQLIAQLAETLDQATATNVVRESVHATGDAKTVSAIQALLQELTEASPKVTRAAVQALPELHRRGGLDVVVSWLDLGVALAGSTGATALKYFKESPLLIGLIDSTAVRQQTLTLALELADRDPNVAFEFFRVAPELVRVLPLEALTGWSEVGVELAKWNYVLGVEFFRQSPALAEVIPLEQLRAWVGFGTKLITENSLGKPDYMGTLEFFRTSPSILGELEGAAVRKSVIGLGSVIADRSPQSAIALLADAASLLKRLPTEDWRVRVLQYGTLVAERDAEAALAYVRRCPEIVALVGALVDAQAKFSEWFTGGMEVLEYSIEGGRSYFALETKKALASVEQAMSGVPLRQVARTLKLFAQGLCGADVTIQPLPETEDAPDQAPVRATVSRDGRTIAMPLILRRYPTREENERLYTVMIAHEVGHLEFGTYRLSPAAVGGLIADVQQRYGTQLEVPDDQAVPTLEQVFHLYPQPGVIRDLWVVLEDARVEFRLRHEYPGLRHDLAVLAQEAVKTRSFLHGMTVREMIVDCLLRVSTAEPGTVQIPDSIGQMVEQVWARCQVILQPQATAKDAVQLADHIYVLLDQLLAAPGSQVESSGGGEEQADVSPGPSASEQMSGVYRPITNWAYRGAMNPDLVELRDDSPGQGGHSANTAFLRDQTQASASDLDAHAGDATDRVRDGLRREMPEREGDTKPSPMAPPDSLAKQLLTLRDDRQGQHHSLHSAAGVYLYDEWDGSIQDYRTGWCRVLEQMAPEGSMQFADVTLENHGPAVRLLRRYFESIRPVGVRRVREQADGDELDLDAAVRRTADRAAGAEPSDRLYIRREKRERDVAVAFLVDLSGSTSRQIDADGRRVIDVEREGLVLLCEALESVGDHYAIYGYSGQGRQQVDFVVLKEFEERSLTRTAQRIGAMAPLQQNRDGAAIRHAVRKLTAQAARVKLLVLISDGKPLDDGYADEYSLEDTKMALREARMRNIEPFCITVDRHADDYLRRMYGDVRFLVIDQAASLPERLPRIYQRLTA